MLNVSVGMFAEQKSRKAKTTNDLANGSEDDDGC